MANLTTAKNIFRSLWFIVLLVATALACNAVSGLGEKVGDTRNTAEAAATEVKEGLNLLGTVQGVATEVGGSGLGKTAQAFATQAEESGLLETAQAFATQEVPALIETAQAAATQARDLLGEAPEDIPVMEETQDYLGAANMVSYTTPAGLDEVVAFYKEAMPAYGWQKADPPATLGDLTLLYYEKDQRAAAVRPTANPLGGTFVIIIITPR
jgi:predicted small secreted protein